MDLIKTDNSAISSPQQPNFQFLYDTMVVRPEWLQRVRDAAHLIVGYRPTYEAFVKAFNPALPWYFVGVIHYMESSCNFHCHLHNGDPLTRRTVQVPKGRPLTGVPPFTWQQSAADALESQGFDKFHEWTVARMLARLEIYNGTGYHRVGIYSPYLFSGTNHYYRGKYVADGQFSMEAVSKQVGAAPILKHIINNHL